MKKFEYKIITISADHLRRKSFQAELDDKFQKWDNEGQDLVKMEPITSEGIMLQGATTESFLAVFKREKISNQ